MPGLNRIGNKEEPNPKGRNQADLWAARTKRKERPMAILTGKKEKGQFLKTLPQTIAPNSKVPCRADTNS